MKQPMSWPYSALNDSRRELVLIVFDRFVRLHGVPYRRQRAGDRGARMGGRR